MSVVRVFIAIALPATLQQKLDEAARLLKNDKTRSVRWVTGKNIHLTLKFLGEVEGEKIDGISQMIQAESRLVKPFEVSASGAGAFPNLRRPRVVWIGVSAPPVLAGLAVAIDRGTQALGFPGEDRPFSPHLTLGRVSQNASPVEVQAIGQALSTVRIGYLGSFTVTHVTLFRSDLQPSGAVYTPLFTAAFQKNE
jgi:RNA 2',3'-cyclic 3'-phosphodiesterase